MDERERNVHWTYVAVKSQIWACLPVAMSRMEENFVQAFREDSRVSLT